MSPSRQAVRHTGQHLRAAGTAVASRISRRTSLPGAIVLAYHDVLPDGADGHDYAVNASRLRQQLDVVERSGAQVVSLTDVCDRFRRGLDLTGLVAIVFDDALVGVHHVAMRQLAERGWPATVHPVLDGLGVDPPWWPGSQRTMTWAELVEAVEQGLQVGAHGTTHACMPCLPPGALAEELRVPRLRLAALTGRRVDELAYPFGHVDPRVRAAAREAGYTTAFTFLNGRICNDTDAWLLPRLTMHQGVTPWRLSHQLARAAGQWPQPDGLEIHPH